MICSAMTRVVKDTCNGRVNSEVARCGEGWNIFVKCISVFWGGLFCKCGCYSYIDILG